MLKADSRCLHSFPQLLPPLLQHTTIQPILASLSLPVKPLLDALQALRAGKRMDSKDADRAGGLSGEGEFLEKYCQDLTKLAEEGKLDPVVGRDDEIRRCASLPCSLTLVISLSY